MNLYINEPHIVICLIIIRLSVKEFVSLCDETIRIQRSPTECMCVWVWSWSVEKWGGLGPQGAIEALEKKNSFRLNTITQMNVWTTNNKKEEKQDLIYVLLIHGILWTCGLVAAYFKNVSPVLEGVRVVAESAY
jgi:hypothetical protein